MSTEVSTWTPEFEGQRPPFETGNGRAITHGAYARLVLSAAAGETADELRLLIPAGADADEPAIQTFAFVLEQMKAAATALEEPGKRTAHLRLSQDAQGWARLALHCADKLGMTPTSRASLGLTLAQGRALTMRRADVSNLSEDEVEQLDAILQKLEGGAK